MKDLNDICGPAVRPATPTTVAQAISFAVDECQEENGIYLGDSTSLRITEVSAELQHLLGGNVEFEVKTSDGRSFTVRVSESY